MNIFATRIAHIYRLLLDPSKQENLVWRDLKNCILNKSGDMGYMNRINV